MILVDTSVWIDYFRDSKNSSSLAQLLQENRVVSHPWIIGELMLGHLGPKRVQILKDLEMLSSLAPSSFVDLKAFVESEKLFGKGLSFIDLELLYTALVEDCLLWTHDRQLNLLAQKYKKSFMADRK